MKMTDDFLTQCHQDVITRSFDKASETYDEGAVLQRLAGERLLERCDLFLMQPTQIIDLGCATGHFTRALSNKYPKAQVMGVDRSADMIALAESKRPRHSQQSYCVADIQTLPFPDAYADFMYSNMVLHWIPSPDRAWREILRVLKPGGVLMFTVPGPDTLKECRASWAAVDNDPHVYSFLDMHDIGDALLHAGFSEPVMDRQDFVMRYAQLNTLFRDLKMTGVTNKMPARARGLTGKRRFALMQAHYETLKTPEGKYPATYEIIYGHAIKSVDSSEHHHDNNDVRIALDQITRRST